MLRVHLCCKHSVLGFEHLCSICFASRISKGVTSTSEVGFGLVMERYLCQVATGQMDRKMEGSNSCYLM